MKEQAHKMLPIPAYKSQLPRCLWAHSGWSGGGSEQGYLVDLVGGAVLAHSDGDGGLVGQGYAQLHVRYAVIVLEGGGRSVTQRQKQTRGQP